MSKVERWYVVTRTGLIWYRGASKEMAIKFAQQRVKNMSKSYRALYVIKESDYNDNYKGNVIKVNKDGSIEEYGKEAAEIANEILENMGGR